MDQLSTDLKGPTRTQSIHHKKYFMTVMEDSTRMTWVYFLRKKSEAFENMVNCLAMIHNQKQLYPVTVLYGGELDTNRMHDLAKRLGITYTTTAANASNQNPLIERKHRTIQEGPSL